jgi:YD repeat-containing protein
MLCAQEASKGISTVTSTPQWEKVKSLIGEWNGYALEAGKKMPARVSVRMTGDGSAVMHTLDPGGPHEMVTMFHMDQKDLLATHYCAAHNQPRMRALPSSQPSRITFEFKDGTNISPGDGFMRKLDLAFTDADHHDETWTFDSSGKLSATTFHMTRVPFLDAPMRK